MVRSLRGDINFIECALVNSTERSYIPYLEPDPISFLEQIICFWVIKPCADLILLEVQTQPCTAQAYRGQEWDVAEGLRKFLMPRS